MKREPKRIEDFLLLFNIKYCEELDCYMQGWDGERGKRISDIALRKIKELYYYLKKDTTSIKSGGNRYFPMSMDKEFIKRISAINIEIEKPSLDVLNLKIKDLQHFKDSSVGLWATDKEPLHNAKIAKHLFFQIEA